MSKTTQYVAIGLSVLITLLLIAAGILAATFNPNDYKPLIVRMVQEKTQRTLMIPGQIRLTLFPRIGVDLGRVSISERNSSAEFASAVSAKLALRLMPLLSKRLVVDHVGIEAIHVNVKRYKDGSSNYGDLLTPADAGSDGISFDVRSVSVTNASIRYEDQLTRRRFQIAKLSLETGELASGLPSRASLVAYVKGNDPAIDARIALKTGFTFYPDRRHYVFDDAEADIKGALSDISGIVLKASGNAELNPSEKLFLFDGIKLSASGRQAGKPVSLRLDAPRFAMNGEQVTGDKANAEARFAQGPRNIVLNLSVPAFDGVPRNFMMAPLALDVAIKGAALDAKAHIAGDVTGDIEKLLFTSPRLKLSLSGKQGGRALDGSVDSPFSANLQTQSIEFAKLAAAFTLPNPAGGMLRLNADGKAILDIGKRLASATLTGRFDESGFDAKLGIEGFSPVAYGFNLNIDSLDGDRYLGKPAASSATAKAAPQAGGQASEHAIDLSALRELNAAGSLRIGSLEIDNIKASNLRIDLRAADGRIEAHSVSANLYGGSVSGSASATATAAPDFVLHHNLVGVRLGPLLKDAFDKQPIEGRGNVRLDVTARGASLAQIGKSLHGTARVELHDGALHGINVARAVREAKARIGAIRHGDGPETGAASLDEKTDFTELAASFVMADGIARNDDLAITSPLLRISGSGSIDLANERLDYLAKATVVSTLQGQDGKELQALKGVTIPVRLSGPFDAIGWRIDFQSVAGELAKQKRDDRKQSIRSKARTAIDEQKNKAHERIGKELEGLLNR
jgi:AsmA protein